MELGSTIISILLFTAFVPGVVTRIPKGGSNATVLVVHAILFSITASLVMKMYWRAREHFGNYGPTCPNGYKMTEGGDCLPVGQATYDPSMLKEKTA
jgi:hypothetical protein